MIYPLHFEDKIGFSQIRAILKLKCMSEPGKRHVDALHFLSELPLIQQKLDLTNEFRLLLLFDKNLPSLQIIDCTDALSQINPIGSWIDQDTLFDLKLSYETIRELVLFIQLLDKQKYPLITGLLNEIVFHEHIYHEIERIIDEKGEIKSNASPELLSIRKQIRSKQTQVEGRISSMLKQLKKEGIAADDIELTIRNSRMVIPVAAANKRKVKGFIHDESASGQTVFIEPAEIFEMNNEVLELEKAEKREIVKILIRFTDLIRPDVTDIIAGFQWVGIIDFNRAKANFAIEIDAYKPLLSPEPQLDWIKARHPLLHLSLKKQKKEVVPFNITLNKDNRILLISGPNAGGKSVCMIAVGLIQYMLQCGLLVPVLEHSEAGIFKKILMDMGDEQSIDNDLSTYSSHLKNMNFMLNESNAQTLFLIDELGSGTEPNAGAAIAEVVLEQLNLNKAFGVVTTHFANLKKFAGATPGLYNGAMLFDMEVMQPLYKLQTGKPGSSFSFEIARRMGISKNLINKAEQKTGFSQLNYEKELQQLEIEKEKLLKEKQEVKVADDFLAEIIDKYNKVLTETTSKKKDILLQAKQEALKIVTDANKLIENSIQTIKETSADTNEVKNIRTEIKTTKETLEKAIQEEKPLANEASNEIKALPNPSAIDIGDLVRIIGQQTIGEVSAIRDNMVLIFNNAVKLKVPIERLEKITSYDDLPKAKENRKKYGSMMDDLLGKSATFKTSIDLRGVKAEEALKTVQNYIDDAILLNVGEVRILHGKGTGVLRKVIREYLGTINEIKAYNDAAIEQGGHGITVVRFK